MDISIFKKLGFSEKATKVYLALIQLGPSSVRKIAERCDLNRGTTYDALRWLQEEKIITYYEKQKKQFFVAESPESLKRIVLRQEEKLGNASTVLEKMIPELQALHNRGGDRPVARYIPREDIPKILEDVLATCEESEEKMYRIYSSAVLREYLYEEFPTFSDVRIGKGIEVRAIAIGEGGELRGLDQRKWLPSESGITPTYIIIYPGKTAYISLDAKNEPLGVIVENDGVYETQKRIFNALWEKL